jgi:hypothetical protein
VAERPAALVEKLGARVVAPEAPAFIHPEGLSHGAGREQTGDLLDPGMRDSTWNATALDWAGYLGRPRMAALLREAGASG